MAAAKPLLVPFKCPECGAPPNKHGKGGSYECADRHSGSEGCSGFLCDCDDNGESKNHGRTFEEPCPAAHCFHCGWRGEFPKPPKRLKLAAWEKQALAAGWAPPAKRAAEISNSVKGKGR